MQIAKPYVPGIRDGDGVRKWLITAYDAIHVQVGERNIARIADVDWQSESAFATFFFGLQRVKFPVRHMIEDYLVAHVVLA